MINLPTFKIGDLNPLEINLIQGGMGVGVSGANLASAVANEGGAGIIATVGLGPLKGAPGGYIESNQIALRKEIRKAKKMSNGVIGVNIMHALIDYDHLVKTSVEENVDLIICGAGIPKDLPSQAGDKNIKLIPIVSSLRFAKLITKAWSKHGKVPDAFIVEGPKAGGHLGFSYEELINGTAPTLEKIVKEVVEFANNPNNFKNPVPVIGAGGIYYGQYIKKVMGWGASGVQMATRVVTTKECDASDKFKKVYLYAKQEDIGIFESPAGMPGRAIMNEFLTKVRNGERDEFGCSFQCLKTCNPKESSHCIANALIEAQQGNFTRGYAFAGENAYLSTPETCLDDKGEFITVKTLMERISYEFNAA